MRNLEEEMINIFIEEVSRELILEEHKIVDEEILQECLKLDTVNIANIAAIYTLKKHIKENNDRI